MPRNRKKPVARGVATGDVVRPSQAEAWHGIEWTEEALRSKEVRVMPATGRSPPLGGVGGDGPPPSAHRGLQGQERTAVRIAQWG